jgi:phage gpG-like protein
MPGSASVQVDDFLAALQAWGERTTEATQAGVKDGAEVVRKAIQDNLSARSYPPASPAGEPPALRTGYLHDNVYVRGPLAVDAGWQARIYPSTVYARIHELSGWAGRGHRSFLPARPYVRTASESSAQAAGDAVAKAWRQALPGGG